MIKTDPVNSGGGFAVIKPQDKHAVFLYCSQSSVYSKTSRYTCLRVNKYHFDVPEYIRIWSLWTCYTKSEFFAEYELLSIRYKFYDWRLKYLKVETELRNVE